MSRAVSVGRRAGNAEAVKANPIEVQKGLAGVSYPTDRTRLLRAAERNRADDDVVQALRDLPEREFDGPDDVMEALGRES